MLPIQHSDVEVPAKTPKQHSLKSPLQSDANLGCTAAGSWPSLSYSNHRTQCWINPHRLIRRPGVTSVPDGNNWMRRGRVNKIFHKRKNGLVKLMGQRMGRLEEIRRGLRAFQVGVQGKLRENAKWKGYSRK